LIAACAPAEAAGAHRDQELTCNRLSLEAQLPGPAAQLARGRIITGRQGLAHERHDLGADGQDRGDVERGRQPDRERCEAIIEGGRAVIAHHASRNSSANSVSAA
jgi:hypothetical protein